jgi:hypothetical protein
VLLKAPVCALKLGKNTSPTSVSRGLPEGFRQARADAVGLRTKRSRVHSESTTGYKNRDLLQCNGKSYCLDRLEVSNRTTKLNFFKWYFGQNLYSKKALQNLKNETYQVARTLHLSTLRAILNMLKNGEAIKLPQPIRSAPKNWE